MQTAMLGSFAVVKTGVPMNRVRREAGAEEATEVDVLVPASMVGARIDDSEIAKESVGTVNEALFTRPGDVVVKASTPYNCVLIDASHAGLLVTSFGLILRMRPGSPVDARYLAAYLSGNRAAQELRLMSKGTSAQLVKKRDIEQMTVPLLKPEEQGRIATTFETVASLRDLCHRLEEKGGLLLESELERLISETEN